MTVQVFLERAQGYYGKYWEGALPWIADYLGQYRESDLEALWKKVLLTFSGRWNYPPDIAVIEEAAKELEMASPGYSRLAWLPKNDAKALPEPLDDGEREGVTGILADWKKEHK